MRRYFATRSIRVNWISVRHYARPPSVRDRQSIHINSEKLCDDLLKRLAKTFDRNGPIDIIDIYPGKGLWSRKVHEFLRPRRHILLEPFEKIYAPYLQPLVQSSAGCKLLPWDPMDESVLTELFSQKQLPEQLDRDLGPKGACQVNPSLLVLANLTRHRDDYSAKIWPLLRYFETCFDQSLIHQYGLVRVITTFLSKDAERILPRDVIHRRRLSIVTEAAASSAVQLCGDTEECNNAALKGGNLWEKSAQATATRAKEAHISTPRGREAKPIELAPKPLRLAGKGAAYFKRPKHDWHDRYLEYVDEFLEHRKKEPEAKSLPDPERSNRFLLLRKRLFLENRQAPLVAEFSDKQLAIDEIYAKLRTIMQAGKPYPARTHTLVSKLNDLIAARDEVNSRLTPLYRTHARQRHQETHGLNSQPPLLLWDRRPFEPLRVHPSDFSPPIPCSIIDFQPDPNSPILQTLSEYTANNNQAGNSTNGQKSRAAYFDLLIILQHLIRTISRGNAKPIDRAIIYPLFPGRPMADVLRAIPSLQRFAKVSATYVPTTTTDDAASNNDQNDKKSTENLQLEFAEDCLSDTSVRVLPVSTLWDIALEWDRWPMRTLEAQELWKQLGGQRLQKIEETYTSRRT